MTRSSKKQGRLALLSFIVLSGALLLAGCSNSGSPSPVAKSDEATGNTTSSTASRDAYDLKLAACLRAAGFNVADPKPGEGFRDTTPAISAAAAKCAEKIGPPPGDLTDADMAAIDAQYLRWAKCFRDRGYTVADPVRGQAFAIPETATSSDISACTKVAK